MLTDDQSAGATSKGGRTMKSRTDTLVGHLIEVGGESFTAVMHSKGGEFQAERMIGMHKVLIGQVGSYLKVSHHGHDIVVMVETSG